MEKPRHGRLPETQPPRRALSSALGWTSTNAVLPGTAFLRAGRRSGWVYLAVFLGIPLLAIIAFFAFDGVDLLLKIAVRPTWLILTAVVVVVAVAAWALLVLTGNHLVNALFGVQGRKRLLSVVVSLALIAVLGVPAGYVVRALGAQRSLLVNSFASEDDPGITGTTHSSHDGEDPWAGEPRLNIMLLGGDSGKGRIGTRPDTIMVASIDTSTGVTSLFSIPRNLQFVEFPAGTVMNKRFPNGFNAYGANQNLINAVWHWAATHPNLFPDTPHPGRTATRHAVEHTLGLKVDRYAMVNLKGFEEIINALGGLTIEVERRIPIGGGVNQATGGHYPITGYIEPGLQTLDGHDALWYARSRTGSNDFDRMCRQQRVIRALTDSVNPAVIASSFIDLVQATEDNVSTSIRVRELDAMIDLFFKVRQQGISAHPITPEVTNTVRPDFDALHQWVETKIDQDMAEAKADSAKADKGTSGKDSAESDDAGGTTNSNGSGSSAGTPTKAPTTPATTAPGTTTPGATAPGTAEAPESALAGCMP